MTELVGEDLGAGLRSAREQSGLTLRHIADATKLSVRSLTALEANRIDQLPGGIYRRAIVRAYASHVGLDPEKTLRAFLQQHPDDVPTRAQFMPAPPARPNRRTLQTVLSLLSALIPILAGVFYFTLSARGSDVPRIAEVLPLPATEPWPGQIVPVSMASRDSDAVSMMLSVSSSTRLQIIADGREVLARTLDAGDMFRLDLAREVVLVGDNAGAVHFSINGRAGRTLGDSGTPLTARIARDNYQHWLIQP
ncbi:MAG TPA: RodZ domain-containing protein [Vicinamibacterales bacterium]|nr:RodZ domain-containing protein [Vicinamibacterales bacterium]